MIFYEATSFGLRVATFEFINNSNQNLKVRLLPMVHIGEEKYYKEVEKYLEHCDIIIYEGLKFKTRRLKIKNRERTAEKLNLVTQSKCLNLKRFKDKLIHADLDIEKGEKEWKKLSVIDKLKYRVFFPIYIYFQDSNITRKKLVKYFMKSNTDIGLTEGPMFDKEEKIKGFINYSRDKIVFDELDKLHSKRIKADATIGIVYGANHMKSIANHLMNNLGYKAGKGKYIEVFKV